MTEVTNPTKLDELTLKKLEEAFAIDASVGEACFYAGISSQTYYNWIDSFPDLKERFDSLREKPVLKARQTIAQNLGEPEHAKWYLERKRKKEFAPRQELTGDEGKDIAFTWQNATTKDNTNPIQSPDIPA